MLVPKASGSYMRLDYNVNVDVDIVDVDKGDDSCAYVLCLRKF